MTHFDRTTRAARAARRALPAVAAFAATALAGCSVDDLTSVETPDVVPPGAVQSVAALPAVFNAAIGEFGLAYQGSSATEGQILYSGLLGDEILLSDTFQTRRQIDSRNMQDRTNSNNETVYRRLQIARTAAERAAAAYATLQPNANASQAEAYSLAGYTYVFFAENYCGGVPFSTLNDDGTVINGAPNTTAQILAIASAKFDSALAVATALNNNTQLRLARVGKARVLVNQGRYADAAALVTPALVPTDFVYQTFSSTNTARQNNGIWSFNRNQRRFSVANSEGTNGLPYRTDNDPRVLTVRGSSTAAVAQNGFDTSPFFTAIKYSEQNSPSTLASGVEARLIEAEAALNANNYAGALTILNALRANTSLYQCPANETLNNFACPTTTPTLPALTDPGTAAGRVQQLFRERAYWLFLTAHRLGDMRRLARGTASAGNASEGLSAYGLGVNNVFPVGPYAPQPGTNYGASVNFPVPFSEGTVNPLYKPEACDDTRP
jgi:hypothetical protein